MSWGPSFHAHKQTRRKRRKQLDPDTPEDLAELERLATKFTLQPHPARVKVHHINQSYKGYVRFNGNVLFAKGPYIGVQLDEKVGRNNGSVGGIQYFDCPHGHGIFVPPDGLSLVENEQPYLEPLPSYDVSEHRYLEVKEHNRHLREVQETLMTEQYDNYEEEDWDEPMEERAFETHLPPQPNCRPTNPTRFQQGAAQTQQPSAWHQQHTWDERDYPDMYPEDEMDDDDSHRAVYWQHFAPQYITWETARVGQRVNVLNKGGPNKPSFGHGVIKYKGEVLFEFGRWIGIELDRPPPTPFNSGEKFGTFYYKCRKDCGIFRQEVKGPDGKKIFKGVEWVDEETYPLPDDVAELRKYPHPTALKRSKRVKKKLRPAQSQQRQSTEEVEDDTLADSPSPSKEPVAAATPAPEVLTDDTTVTVQCGDSDMGYHPLANKIWGVMFGAITSNSIALATRQQSAQAIFDEYNDHVFQYATIPEERRQEFYDGTPPPGAVWTTPIDEMICLIHAMIDRKGAVNEKAYSHRLKEWSEKGFPDLHRKAVPALCTKFCVEKPAFENDPHTVALSLLKHKSTFPTNEPIIPCVLTGIARFADLDRVVENTKRICKTTNPDPKCVASCVAIAVAIAMLLQKERNAYTAEGLKAVLERAELEGRKCGVPDEDVFKWTIFYSNLNTLELDKGQISDPYKCLGAAFYTFRTGTSFKQSIVDVVRAGGDSDYNAAAAGALLGAKLGMWELFRSEFPEDNVVISPWPPTNGFNVDEHWYKGIHPYERDTLTDLLNEWLSALHLTEGIYATQDTF